MLVNHHSTSNLSFLISFIASHNKCRSLSAFNELMSRSIDNFNKLCNFYHKLVSLHFLLLRLCWYFFCANSFVSVWSENCRGMGKCWQWVRRRKGTVKWGKTIDGIQSKWDNKMESEQNKKPSMNVRENIKWRKSLHIKKK